MGSAVLELQEAQIIFMLVLKCLMTQHVLLETIKITVSYLFSNGKGEPSQQGFGASLLKSLLDNMPYLPAAATGGKSSRSEVVW